VELPGARVVGGQHGYRHLTATLADGREVFVKAADSAGHDPERALVFAAEANGLRWLREAGAVPVPDVVAVEDSMLVIDCLPPGQATPEAAEEFGANLARTHAAGAPYFGADWPGYIASLPLDNTPSTHEGAPSTHAEPDNTPSGHDTTCPPYREWGEWWEERRIVPYIRRAVDAGVLSRGDARLAETVGARAGELGGPAERPSRIHGDLWAGNVLWSGGRGWVIDPAAHGGHRESDLAMLALFGAPHLERILSAYDVVYPLADGWRARVPLHQMHPLLVHVCLFGGSYVGQLRAAARAALAIA
jgi:fructosamine-3-kinase